MKTPVAVVRRTVCCKLALAVCSFSGFEISVAAGAPAVQISEASAYRFRASDAQLRAMVERDLGLTAAALLLLKSSVPELRLSKTDFPVKGYLTRRSRSDLLTHINDLTEIQAGMAEQSKASSSRRSDMGSRPAQAASRPTILAGEIKQASREGLEFSIGVESVTPQAMRLRVTVGEKVRFSSLMLELRPDMSGSNTLVLKSYAFR